MRRTRRAVALALAAVALAGLSVASASQLTVRTGTLQSGRAVVGTCQPAGQAVRVALTSAWVTTAYSTSGVTLSGVAPACDRLAYRLQLVSATGAPLDANGTAAGTELTGTVVLAGDVLTVALPAGVTVPTASVAGVALVVHG